METKQINFNKKSETQLGNVGETIIYEYLIKNNYIIYKPINDDAHLIDGFAIKDMKDIIAFDVKTKPRRIKYEDTGIDIKHYNRYKYITDKYSIPVYLFFVDGLYKKVYGNYLHILDQKYKGYPLDSKGIRYFHLDNMIIITELEDYMAEYLMIHSNRNYDYEKGGTK